MKLLIILELLMCIVLLAWAALQQPYLTKTLSAPPLKNPHQWMHCIIFEPQPQIQLTHSSYKVTTFLDFQPFLQGFQNVKTYLDHLWIDVQDSHHFQYLFLPIMQAPLDPTVNNSHISDFLKSTLCVLRTYECQARLKYEKFKWEICYILDIFNATYKKFLVAIDHIDYHPSQNLINTTRQRRSLMYENYGYYHSPTKTLTPSEEYFLTAFMNALSKINPKLHKSLHCMKRVGIFTWILGWGVYSNARNTAKIKKNLHILQEQNQLQDKQIKQLAKFLNLTMHHVDKHSEMLYELDTKLTIINKTIKEIMWNVDVMWYESNLMHFFQTKLYRVYSSLYALWSDTESLFEYMRALASQELNPLIIPPNILKDLLHKIEHVIKSHARLKLCENPDSNIWSYYGTIKLTTMVLRDCLMLILMVPLVDQSLQLNLYKVYNLPMLHPELHVHAQYELESSYIANVMDGMYVTLPTTLDVRLCLMTN